MKSALIISVFFILIGILYGSNGTSKKADRITVEFKRDWLNHKQSIKSVKLIEDVKKAEILIELEQFRPDSKSRRFSKLSFRVPKENCKFISTKPVLFRCSGESFIAKTKVAGLKVQLLEISSTSYVGQELNGEGFVKEARLYAVKIGLKMGRKNYDFNVHTTPTAVKSGEEVAFAPVAQVR